MSFLRRIARFPYEFIDFFIRVIQILLRIAPVFYVSPNGDDDEGEGSADRPWKTVEHALNRINSWYWIAGMPPLLILRPGTYDEDTQLRVSTSVEIAGEGGSENVTIRGGVNSNLVVWNLVNGVVSFEKPFPAADTECVACNPDGTSLATHSGNNTITLVSTFLGVFLREFRGHTARVTSLAFSPDGQLLASSSEDGTVRIWEVETGTWLRRIAADPSGVNEVAFSPDGESVVSAGDDSVIKLWRVADGTLIDTFEGHDGNVYTVAFSPDGRRIASGGLDKTVQLWDVANAELIDTFKPDGRRITSVAFHPDGHRIASSCFSGWVYVWEPDTGNDPVLTLPGHDYRLMTVAYSPDGSTIASAAQGLVLLRDSVTGDERTRMELPTASVSSLAYSPDGTFLALATMAEQFVFDISASGTRRFPVTLRGITIDCTGSRGWRTLALIAHTADVRLTDVKAERPRGGYVIEFRDCSFAVEDCVIDTQTYGTDVGIEVVASEGTITRLVAGPDIDHIISVQSGSNVVIEDSELAGAAEVSFADGVRILGEADCTIRRCTITRPEAERTTEGSGVEIGIPGGGGRRITVEECQIAGFFAGITVTVHPSEIPHEIIVQRNTIDRNITAAIETAVAGGTSDLTPPIVDAGGGPLESAGQNSFGASQPHAFYHRCDYDVYARNNIWNVPEDAIPDRIRDQEDNPELGRVIYDG